MQHHHQHPRHLGTVSLAKLREALLVDQFEKAMKRGKLLEPDAVVAGLLA